MAMLRVWVAVLVVGLAAAGAFGSDELRRHRSSQYTILHSVDDETVREIGRHMDVVFREYARRFSSFPVRNGGDLTLYVFGTEAEYMAFFSEMGMNATGSGGMFFHGGQKEGLAVFLGERPLDVVLETLRHEGLHQFAYQRVHENMPQWLNEGMAEWFGYAIETRRGLEPGVVDGGARDRVRAAIENGVTFPLDELLFMTNAEWNARLNAQDARAGVMYDQSWSVVHFLVNAENGKYERLLWDYLRAVWQGMSSEQAAEKVFTRDLDPMEEAWKGYVEAMRADPLLVARSHLRIYALALEKLFAEGVQPESVDEMVTALMERKFEGTRTVGERVMPISGDPASAGGWWIGMPESLRGRGATVRMVKDRREKTPPRVEVRGLRQSVRLEWAVDRAGGLSWEVVVG
ncbi:MAG: DUF1570 domain-containing protein [Phycisphaerales bacterium JB040]